MMKQLIQQARKMVFEPVQPRHLESGPSKPPATHRRMSADQQRIALLETQNQQLRADLDRLKNFSTGFAHELRDLLTEATQAGFSTGARNAQGLGPQAKNPSNPSNRLDTS